jgi:hypothetical protein
LLHTILGGNALVRCDRARARRRRCVLQPHQLPHMCLRCDFCRYHRALHHHRVLHHNCALHHHCALHRSCALHRRCVLHRHCVLHCRRTLCFRFAPPRRCKQFNRRCGCLLLSCCGCALHFDRAPRLRCASLLRHALLLRRTLQHLCVLLFCWFLFPKPL